MPEDLTAVIESAVGVACLAGAAASWRRPRLRWLAALLAIAGAVAFARGILALAG